jgi:hypothetical protein
MIWIKTAPKLCGYYHAIPRNRDDWLDAVPEIVYVYFDGKWSAIRPGISRGALLSDFGYWCGPIEQPGLPIELMDTERGEG